MKTAKLILLFSLCFWFEPNKAQNLEVISYNIRYSTASDSLNYWENRKFEMVDFLQKESPQIIGFQEVLLNQLQFLSSQLSNYCVLGVGRDDGKQGGEFSPIFVDTIHYKIIESGTFWLSETPEKPSKGWDAALNRICTWAKLEFIQTGRCLYVYNSHFDHMGKIARDSSSHLILTKINQHLKIRSLPIIVMGDFNSEPAEPAIQRFSKTLLDASQMEKDSLGLGTFNGFKSHSSAFKQIDFIFYLGLKKVGYQTLRPLRSNQLQLSDHYAVKAVFQ